MRAIYIIVEGQTEEEFVKKVLCHRFYREGIYDIRALLMRTGHGGKGGAITYDRFKSNVIRLCKSEPDVLITSLIDFFRLDTSFPGVEKATLIADKFARVAFLEEAIANDIGQKNVLPYLQLHEFEGLLFSDISGFDIIPGLSATHRTNIQAVISAYPTPEHINDGPETAPSKRLEKLIHKYNKTLHGPYIAEQIGIDLICEKCARFSTWLEKLICIYKAGRSS